MLLLRYGTLTVFFTTDSVSSFKGLDDLLCCRYPGDDDFCFPVSSGH